MSKYPSLTELTAQGYPGARKIEIARQAEVRYRKQVNAAAKRTHEAQVLDAFVKRVSGHIRRNDHPAVEKALHEVVKRFKL